MITKYLILDKRDDVFCIRVLGWGIYGLHKDAEWIPFSVKSGERNLILLNGYFIEFMIPLWIQKIKSRIKYGR